MNFVDLLFFTGQETALSAPVRRPNFAPHRTPSWMRTLSNGQAALTFGSDRWDLNPQTPPYESGEVTSCLSCAILATGDGLTPPSPQV